MPARKPQTKKRAPQTQTQSAWRDVESTGGFWTDGIDKWSKGKVVVGRVFRLRNLGGGGDDGNRDNFVADMVTDEGRVTIGVPTILKGYFDGIQMLKSRVVRIGCKGKIELSNGREAWDFKVQERTLKLGEYEDPGADTQADVDDDTNEDDELPF